MRSGYLLVAAAACLWATLGLFFSQLHDAFGFSALTIAFLRAGIAALVLLVVGALARPGELRVSPRAFVFLVFYGLAGVAAFYFLYAQAVIATNVTTAVVLLYTAPGFVTVMAWRFWGEPLTARKLSALGLAFVGCALVARAYNLSLLRLNLFGLAIGLGAGFTYALYTILSKFALERHSSWTALTYAFVLGACFLAPQQSPEGFAPLARDGAAWLLVIGLAVGPTLGSYALYNAGLQRVPASNASLVAMLEPVIASVLAFIFLGERLELLQWVGGALVIAGAVLVNVNGRLLTVKSEQSRSLDRSPLGGR